MSCDKSYDLCGPHPPFPALDAPYVIDGGQTEPLAQLSTIRYACGQDHLQQ